MAKTRTFLAVVPSPDIVERAERALLRLRRLSDNVKWVERANLHWTLHFLGDLDDQDLYEVCQAAERALANFEPFSLSAIGVGAFPSNDRPRTLWIGAGAGSEKLEQLHAALEAELRPLGFRGENRRYVPHLTLGRSARTLTMAETVALAEELAKLTDYDAASQMVDEVAVFASRLKREGADYTAIASIGLEG
jgi:2'-5' RNA ligase